MKTTILKQAIATAVLAMATTAAHAASVTFFFDYLAGASAAATPNPNGSNATSANLSASGAAGYSLGSLTLTDLSDLNLGDGKTGVRSSLNLNFSPISSGTGSIWLSSYELNFPGTSTANFGAELSSLPNTPGGGSLNLGNNTNWRYVSGQSLSNIRAGGAIEFAEDGNVNGWGQKFTGDPSFEQEINFAAGAYTGGNSTIDFLNGDSGYNSFSVASLLGNPVGNGVLDGLNPSARPDAFAWLKIRSTNGGIDPTKAGLLSTRVIATNVTTQSLNVLSIAAVPETDTYAMLLAGLGIMGMMVNRRQKFSV